jgi:hypothetical protein
MAKNLDECTPLELHHKICSIDCTQDRAHEIARYAHKCYEETEGENLVAAEAWYTLVCKVEKLWGDYEYWHTNDRF